MFWDKYLYVYFSFCVWNNVDYCRFNNVKEDINRHFRNLLPSTEFEKDMIDEKLDFHLHNWLMNTHNRGESRQYLSPRIWSFHKLIQDDVPVICINNILILTHLNIFVRKKSVITNLIRILIKNFFPTWFSLFYAWN